MKRLTFTLALLKPDIYANPQHHQTVLNVIKKEDFIIATETVKSWNKSQAKEFYQEHDGKFFQQRLVEFMSSGEFHALILAHESEDAIGTWRRLLGMTKCYKARQYDRNSIRSLLGLSDTRNAGHGSDSVESFNREANLLFPGWACSEWSNNLNND